MSIHSRQPHRRPRYLHPEFLERRITPSLILTPAEVRSAYGFNETGLTGAGQKIAIIVFYNDPTIFDDVNHFDLEYSATTGGPSLYDQYGASQSWLTVDNQAGLETGDDLGAWESETALDVEWAHAIAPQALILLIEEPEYVLNLDGPDTSTEQNYLAGLGIANNTPGVSVVSMSFYPAEFPAEQSLDYSFMSANGQGITYVANSGNSGVVSYPAASGDVLGVGGTTLSLDYDSATGQYAYGGESADGSSGGGASVYEPKPQYQQGIIAGGGMRATPDVSYSDGPFAIYDSSQNPPNTEASGTDAGAPQWAALIALADQGRQEEGLGTLDGATETLPLLYHLPSTAFNAISGANGYSLATGLGSPVAPQVISDLMRPFVIADGGASLYQVDGDGNLWLYDSSGWLYRDNNVASIQEGGDGGIYVLSDSGHLDRYTAAGGWTPVDDTGDVASITVSGDGGVYVLDRNGDLNRYDVNPSGGSPWFTVDASGDVASVVAGGDGGLYVLDKNGDLNRYDYNPAGGPWFTVDDSAEVASIVPGGDGGVYVLDKNGNLNRYDYNPAGGPWSSVDDTGDVESVVASGDTGVYILDKDGDVNRYFFDPAGSPWYTVDNNEDVASLVASVDGGVYLLDKDGDLNRYSYDPTFGPWTNIDESGDVRQISQNGVNGAVVIDLTDGAFETFTFPDSWAIDAPALVNLPAKISQSDATFNWSTVMGAVEYHVEIIDTKTDTVIVNGAAVSATSYVPASKLTVGDTYLWWVTAVDASGDVSVDATPDEFTVIKNSTAPATPGNPVTKGATGPTGNPSPINAYVISEKSIFERRTTKKGKPIGKAVLSGFQLQFSTPLEPTSASMESNFAVDFVAQAHIRRKVVHVFRPVTTITSVYVPSSVAVDLILGRNVLFPLGGRISVLGGLQTASGGVLTGTATFTISKGGKIIAPA